MHVMRYLSIVLFIMVVGISSIRAQTAAQQGIEVGNKAPEIVENSLAGNPLKLSSLANPAVMRIPL